jgi:hypothetical protein
MKKYFNVCHICGAHLDPSEHCDCKTRCRETATRFEELTGEESGGQLTFLPDTNEKSFWKIDRRIVK